MSEKDKEAPSSGLSSINSRWDFLKASITACKSEAQVVPVLLLLSPHKSKQPMSSHAS